MNPDKMHAINGLYAAWLRAKMFRDSFNSPDITLLSVGHMTPGEGSEPPEAEIFFLESSAQNLAMIKEIVQQQLDMIALELYKLGAAPPLADRIAREMEDGGPGLGGRDSDSGE